MKVIGIVGGIASGKSLVAHFFRQLGAYVLDADRIGHGVLQLDSVKQAIAEHWGKDVFNSDGEVDRRAMAQTVFGLDLASRERLSRLEHITHPIIAQRMRDEIEQLRQSHKHVAVVLDAPVLMKAGWNRFCDKILYVESDAETRKKRASSRGWSEDEWRRREALQTPLDELKRLADAVIDNSSTPEETQKRVEKIWRSWGLPSSESE